MVAQIARKRAVVRAIMSLRLNSLPTNHEQEASYVVWDDERDKVHTYLYRVMVFFIESLVRGHR